VLSERQSRILELLKTTAPEIGKIFEAGSRLPRFEKLAAEGAAWSEDQAVEEALKV
jgi:hypothetical protein